MASITLTGTLLDPTGEVAVGDQIRFTHRTTTGETIQFARSLLIIPPNGMYNFTLEFGLIFVEYLDVKDVNYKNLGVVTVNGDTTATDLPALLNSIVPPTDAQLLLFQAILQDTEDARDIAVAAAAQQTALELISSTVTHPAGTVLAIGGYILGGDEGDERWKVNGIVGQPVSQSPAQLVAPLINDGNGVQWEVNTSTDLKIKSIGGDPLAVDNKDVFLAAEASAFIRIDLQGGSYTTSLISSPQDQPLKKSYFNGEVFIVSSITSEPELFKNSINTNDYEITRQRTKSPQLGWEGLNVLWLGTSLPHQGVGVDSYPELFGESLKCFVDNQSFSGTSANFDFTADPFNITTVKALSMTEDDRQAGLTAFGSSSAYDDSFDPITKASQMTVDHRIKDTFAATPFDVVVLDHNHNDRALEAGEISPTELTINSITIGATTDLILSDASSIAVNDSITARVNGIPFLDYVSGTVTAKASNTITLNLDSTSYGGTFTDGTVQKVNKATFFGAWQFLIFYINNQAIISNIENVKIILCGAPSEHTNDTVFENSIFRSAELIKEIAEKFSLSFFDIGFEYDIKKDFVLTYFPDGVHPTTLETRKSLVNYWIEWASGGRQDFINTDDFLPSSTTLFLDQREAIFSQLRDGFSTPDEIILDSGAIIDEDFSTGIGAWTTNGTAPVPGAAPWGVGQAVFCDSTIATPQSSLTQNITGTTSWSIEFNLWMPEVSGLTDTSSSKTVDLCHIRPTGAAYALQLLIRQETATLKMTYFKEVNVDLVTLGTSKKLLSKEFKHLVRIDMEKATSGDNGFMAVFLDGERVISGSTEDSLQQTPTKVNIGVQSSNTGKDLGLYIGNILLTGKETIARTNETNSVTPVVDFATTGDFVPSYTVQSMQERRDGNVVYFNVGLIFDTNAFTTASGNFSIGGLTHAAASLGTFYQQSASVGPFSNVTLGTGRSLEAFVTGTTIQFRRSQNAGAHGSVGVTNILPSTSAIELNVSGQYTV